MFLLFALFISCYHHLRLYKLIKTAFDLVSGILLEVLIFDLTHLINVGLHEVVGVLSKELIQTVVCSILVILIVGYQYWRLFGDFLCLLKIEERLYSIGNEVLRVKYVIEGFRGWQPLLGDEVLFIVDTDKDA